MATSAADRPKPFIKFVGGKTQILDDIHPLLPAKIDGYYEPFVGGGALFFSLAEKRRFRFAVLGDANKELTITYCMVRERPEEVIAFLDDWEKRYALDPEGFYYALRDQGENADLIERAARFIFLNKTCFNGLHRVNRSGKFNVPWGKKKVVASYDRPALLAASKALHKVIVRNRDFEETVKDCKKGDFVYFDPPYLPVSKTASFRQYTKNGFGVEEHQRLAAVGKRLKKAGVGVLVSNADSEQVLEIFAGYRAVKVLANRAVNSKGERRGAVSELLLQP